MPKLNTFINSLNNKLITLLERKDIPLGLADGKMGLCIYFYHTSYIINDLHYRCLADNLLDEVYDKIGTINTVGAKNGLSGIGLGIDYLIRNNYVEGDPNIILSDIDDVIFRYLSYEKYYQMIDTRSLIHTLFYLAIRYNQLKPDSENQYLFRELIFLTVNNLYIKLPTDFYEEPLSYDTDYNLPQFLFILSELYKLDIYNYRLIKIIEEISFKVLSLFPVLQSNRLFLLWGMDALNKQIKDKEWEEHIHLLRSRIDINHIFEQEMRNRNVYFNNGITSIYSLASSLPGYFSEDEKILIRAKTIDKIEMSDIWSLLNNDGEYFRNHIALYSGYTGVALLLNNLKYLSV